MKRLLLALIVAAQPVMAQPFDPLAAGRPGAPAMTPPIANRSHGMTPTEAPAGLREHAVRTPPPANAVELSAGVAPPPGKVALKSNMPGHRRFRPPLFPDAGWDSPVVGGRKDYARYLGVYWRAPYLTPQPWAPYPGLEIRGWTPAPPHRANIVRSQATPQEEALFERRMAFIAEQVMASNPMRDPHGASIEPILLLSGYGAEHGSKAKALMRGEITFELNLIQPHTGGNQRIGGAVRSYQKAAWLKVYLNPARQADCPTPYERTSSSALCFDANSGVFWRGGRAPWAGSGLMFDPGFYDDRGASTDLRMIAVQYGGGSHMGSELDRGRLHPNDPYGRAIGALLAIDWASLLARAAAIT